jgi:GntR family transcriptional regulator
MPPRQNLRRAIVADVIGKIDAREPGYLPGDKLPSITQLAVLYECSQEPVKAALIILEDRGYTEPHQGRGTYVAANPPAPGPGARL